MNILVIEEAVGGLWNISVGEDHKEAIAEAGGIKALCVMIFKWSNDGDRVLQDGSLAKLVTYDKCSMEVAAFGSIHALVMLPCNCKHDGVPRIASLDSMYILQWFLKDLTETLGRCHVHIRSGSNLDNNAKLWGLEAGELHKYVSSSLFSSPSRFGISTLVGIGSIMWAGTYV
ncbi:ARABIDILLO 1-like protein, partial [Tanacetum coccineum]